MISEETNVVVLPGVTKSRELRNWLLYSPAEEEDWRLPLLVSMLEVRDNRWEVKFDEEEEDLGNDEAQAIIDDVCTG